jgi:UDP-N-acetylmuramoylalanine--D-glutamate ligase
VKPAEFANRRVVIVGLARQGSALARFFSAQGAHVVITDIQPAVALESEMAALAGLPIQYALGGHPSQLLDECDLVCLSGGVPPETPFPQEARRRGIPLTNDSALTLQLAPAPAIGVTGSSGKTTTTTLVGEILRASGFRTWVGGNIGTPLIDRLREIAADDQIVLELSSFQLQLFAAETAAHAPDAGAVLSVASVSPHIAAVLNVTPNHLDRHPSMAHYTAAKANILRFQGQGGVKGERPVAVLGLDNAITRRWWQEGRVRIEAGEGQPAVHFPIRAHMVGFGLEGEVPEGAFLSGERLIWRHGGQEAEICAVSELKLLGRHNVLNVLAACAISGAAGAVPEAMRQVATTFAGIAHRLELVRELGGVRWYNDSIATAPERVVAALRSFEAPLVLLAGGRDKHLPWDEMADLALERVRYLVVFGEAAALIGEQIAQAQERHKGARSLPVRRCADLQEAVEAAAQVAQRGDVVLLSPGGTSFDAYRDFEQRGEHFRALVWTLRAPGRMNKVSR